MKTTATLLLCTSLFSFLFSFLSLPLAASAEGGMVMTEIMYDAPGTDTGHEWIEIYNAGSEAVPPGDIVLFESNVNHSVSAYGTGDSLPAGAYAVLTPKPELFLADYPAYAGVIFSVSFSLNNEGEELTIKLKGEAVDTAAYDVSAGAKGNGATLHRQESGWAEGVATPGEEGELEAVGEDMPASAASPATASPASAKSAAPAAKAGVPRPIAARLDVPKTASANVPIRFKAEISGRQGEKLTKGKFVWSFGDGISVETGDQPAEHAYLSPGTHLLVFEYYEPQSDEPAVVSRARIDVHDTEIAVSAKKVHHLSYAEIKNNGKAELDLGGWHVSVGDDARQIAKYTIVLPGKSIVLASVVLPSGSQEIVLLYPNGLVAAQSGAEGI